LWISLSTQVPPQASWVGGQILASAPSAVMVDEDASEKWEWEPVTSAAVESCKSVASPAM
jgi:hypothetical protein